MLFTAWATVALTGRDGMSDQEFERLVRRSEELAGQPDLRDGTEEFDLLVAEAIDALPEEFQRLLDETPVVVSRRGAEHRAYGHYFGDTVARDNYPDRIVRLPGHPRAGLRIRPRRAPRPGGADAPPRAGAPPGLGRARGPGARTLKLR